MREGRVIMGKRGRVPLSTTRGLVHGGTRTRSEGAIARKRRSGSRLRWSLETFQILSTTQQSIFLLCLCYLGEPRAL
jgi:hypothetical protein